MTITANISPQMIADRGMKLAGDLRAAGFPVMGIDEPDMFLMVGLTFRVSTGQLVNFRLHYDLATEGNFRRLAGCFGEPM